LSPFPVTGNLVVTSAQTLGADEGKSVGDTVGTAVGTGVGDSEGASVSSPPHRPHDFGQFSGPSGILSQRLIFFAKNLHFNSLSFLATKNLVVESSQQLSQETGHISGPSGNRSHLVASLLKKRQFFSPFPATSKVPSVSTH